MFHKKSPSHASRENLLGNRKKEFNPMKNMHLWVMWRTAVNERIIRETKKKPTVSADRDSMTKILTSVPLAKYIHLQAKQSGEQPYRGPHRERHWLSEDDFQTRQLIYFGLPRPRLIYSGESDYGLKPDY